MARLLLLSTLAAAACSPSFDRQYLVTDLRILAIRVEAGGGPAADVSPGQPLALRALVANPRGRAGAVVQWYACAPDASEAATPCRDAEMLADPGRLTSDPRVARLGQCAPAADGDCLVSATLPDFSAALDYALATAARDPAFACRPYAEWPVVAVARAGDRQVIALKRIRVIPSPAQLASLGLSYAANTNPDIGAVVRARPTWGTCDGGIPVVPGPFPSGETTLCAEAATGASDAFASCGPAGERVATSEHPSWQWYVTDGRFPDFDDGSGNANRNEPRFVRPAGPFTLWTIVRDGRGGEGWRRSDVGAAP